ncbi:MAG: DNA mismatch repair endonuclease MutL, partial [Planctomycetota bacterium]
MPAPIRPLPPELVNQIAAGEVVERPASVLKELVENSLDAGARRIEIAIEEGGRRLLRVVDDGAGIAAEQLPLAVASHATSKLHALEQLFSIRSLGFRGEALASIGSVSELRLASRPPGQPCGAEIRVRGGLAGEVRPSAVAVGTLVEVRNLFFNTPARRKFLGSPAAESRACARTLMRLALASPEVGMRLRSGGRTLIEAPPSEGEHALRERVTALFGRAVTDDLVPVAFERDGLVVRGLAALPRRNRGDSTHQFVALKVRGGRARPIRDKLIAAAIREAYRGLLMTRRHAVVFLELELGAEDVDVNVHPAKLEVRFRHGSNVFGTVVRALRAALDGALAPAVLETSESPPAPPPAATPASSSDDPRWAWRPRPITRHPPAAPVSEGASETASAASATSTATSARPQTAETLASSAAGASSPSPAPS